MGMIKLRQSWRKDLFISVQFECRLMPRVHNVGTVNLWHYVSRFLGASMQ